MASGGVKFDEAKRKSSKRIPRSIPLIYLFGNRRKDLGERGMVVVAWYTGGVNMYHVIPSQSTE